MESRINKKRIRKKTVTLIELLIAVSLFALVGSGIYRGLVNSLSVFRRIREASSNISALIFTERLADDLNNLFFDSTFYFQGEKEHLTFFIHRPVDKEAGGWHHSVLRVKYIYDPQEELILRSIYPYGNDDPLRKQVVLRQVKSLFLAYYRADESKDSVGFFDQTDRLPEAVKVSFAEGNGRSYETVINLALSNHDD